MSLRPGPTINLVTWLHGSTSVSSSIKGSGHFIGLSRDLECVLHKNKVFVIFIWSVFPVWGVFVRAIYTCGSLNLVT